MYGGEEMRWGRQARLFDCVARRRERLRSGGQSWGGLKRTDNGKGQYGDLVAFGSTSTTLFDYAQGPVEMTRFGVLALGEGGGVGADQFGGDALVGEHGEGLPGGAVGHAEETGGAGGEGGFKEGAGAEVDDV